MKLTGHWFTEIAQDEGIALSLQGARHLHSEQTPWQTIDIYETDTFGTLMVIDGCVMVTDRDNFIYHEMLVHPALFTHPRPRQVLIIGGGDCGTLREVLRHPEVESVVQAEIDERVTRLAEEYFPELTEANGDRRAHLYFGDGIEWVKRARDDSLDVIIIDSTDPVGPATGLFGEPFYRQCARVLRPDGLLVQQSESPFLHVPLIRDMRAAMGRAGFDQTRLIHFPQPTYPSGWWSATLAGRPPTLEGFRKEAAERKAFPTRYYNASIHEAAAVLPVFLLGTGEAV